MGGNYLLFLHTVLENVLHHQTAGFTQCNFMPHSTECLIHLGHDLRGIATPAELKKLLPNMASIAVNHRLWDSAEKLVYHHSFILLWHAVKGLLDDMTAKRIHAQSEGISSDCIGNGHNLFRGSMLKTTLDEEVTESIDHKWVRLSSNRLDDIKLLFSCTDFELLL